MLNCLTLERSRQLLRCSGITRKGVAAKTLALDRYCIESATSAFMQQPLHLKKGG